MDDIGHQPLWNPAKPARDPAGAMIFPAIEPGIPAALDDALERWRPGAWRYQIFTPARMLRFDLLQASQPQRPFQEVLREVWQAWRQAGFATGPMPSSSATAQARARQPEWPLQALLRHTAGVADRWPPHPLCPEHRLRAIDGVPLLLPCTPHNLAHFGTTRSQHGDAYYPQAVAVWVSRIPGFVVTGEYLGTSHQSDQSVAPEMLAQLVKPGDLVLGDAHFGTYPTMGAIHQHGAFHLVRAAGTFLPEKHRVGDGAPDDLDLVVTPTPYVRCHYRRMALPQALPMRGVTFDIPARDGPRRTVRTLFLTNLPRATFPRSRLATLTPLRWGEETLHNDIKTRLGLGEIRSGDPRGVYREILAHLCLSNLLRLFLSMAHPTAPWEGSFTAARSAVGQANHQLRWQPEQRDRIFHVLAEMIRRQPVDVRPGRHEPRRKRPKRHPYPVFKTPRADWRLARKAG